MRVFVLLLFFLVQNKLFAVDSRIEKIVASIIQTQQAIIQAEETKGTKAKDLVFLSFSNFDKTILDGDSTDGSYDIYGTAIFKGLAQKTIEAGFSKKYPSKGGFSEFSKDYEELEMKDEPASYAYAIQMLAGANQQEVLNFATDYFENTLKQYLFQDSLDLINMLQQQGIKVHIITASPKIFVQGAAKILNLPLNQFSGMETKVKNGILTDQMILPLTTRQGKVEKIAQIAKEYAKQNKKVYVLAGFGNNNFNDMVFLKWIGNQNLPQGTPLSLISYIPPVIPQKNFVLVPLSRSLGIKKGV